MEAASRITPGTPAPNLWTVLQKWILALPTNTDAERSHQQILQKELEWLVEELGGTPGLDHSGFVFAHTDLLSGNVIVEEPAKSDGELATVSFVDYEYATPSPAAFDIANHFAEWAGFDCEHDKIPTKAQRLDFLSHYVHSYRAHQMENLHPRRNETTMNGVVKTNGDLAHAKTLDKNDDLDQDVLQLYDEIDRFRGVPGFYWGIWGLIQATISQIDFDYATYAETRLGEYWAWKGEHNGSRARLGKEMHVREKRWAQEK